MNLRWLWLDLVPSEISLNIDQRLELNRRLSVSSLPRTVRIASGAIIALALMMLAGLIAQTLIDRFHPALVILLSYAIAWVGYAAIFRAHHRRKTYRGLREIGFDVCSRCGYWLRGLASNVERCPECGAARSPLAEELRE